MARDPHDRYTSAAAIADDLEHYLADEPVVAHPEGPLARLRRWTRHHPKIVGSLAAALLMGLLGTMMLWGFAQIANERLKKERLLADRARVRADNVAEFIVEAFSSTDPERDGKTVTVYEVLRRKADELAKNRIQDPRINAAINQTIGRALLNLGVYADAVPRFKQAYDVSLENFGPDDIETRELKEDWMAASAAAGSAKKTIDGLREALQDNLSRYGAAAPETLNAMNNLAVAYVKAKDWRKTIELLEPNYNVAESNLSAAELLGWENNLAIAYQETGQAKRALPLFRHLTETGADILGPDDPHSPLLLRNLANCLFATGQLDESADLAKQALGERLRLLAPDSPDIRDSLRQLAAIQLNQGDFRAAAATSRQWLDALPTMQNRTEEERADAQLDLADALLGLERTSEALAMAQAAVPALAQLAPDSAKRLRGELLLACLRGLQETTPSNEAELENLYHQLERQLPELSLLRRWFVLRACEQISACYDHWQQPSQVTKWRDEAKRVEAEIVRLRDVQRTQVDRISS